MIETLTVRNLGPLGVLDWRLGPGLNVIIGHNDTGKTLLLKALYVCIRTIEAWRRGDDVRTVRQILDEKLTWTFQLPSLGDLVTKGQDDALAVRMTGQSSGGPLELDFRLTKKAKRGVGEVTSSLQDVGSTSLFIPAKEVLSLIPAIKESRQAQRFGFDDPTYDLVQALELAPSRGTPPFGNARQELERLVDGRVEERGGSWYFKRDRHRYPVTITAEGIKKIAIVDRLIVNRSLTAGSVLFVDEPESFLHPRALMSFLSILATLTEHGMQVVLATHSLTALRKITALARRSAQRVPLLSLDRGSPPAEADLRQGMPPNPLSAASVALYEEELELPSDGGV